MIEDLNKAVFTTKRVLEGAPITHVFFDIDGDWQFFNEDDELTEENARIISLNEVLQIDSSLEKIIKTLPRGFEAYKKKDEAEWFINYDEGLNDNLN